MRFSIEQHFSSEPKRVIRAYTNPTLYPSLTGLTRVATPKVISYTTDQDKTDLLLQMRLIAAVSTAARAIIDPDQLSWLQQEKYDLASETAAVVFHPDNYSDRFSCSGTYRFCQGSNGGTKRVIDGDIRVRVPLVGREVERAIVSGLRDHFAQEQPLVETWMQKNMDVTES